MCVALITFHVCNLYRARDIYISQKDWRGSSVRCVCLCVSRSIRTVCTAVTQAINFVINPRTDAPARYTVERATLHIYIAYVLQVLCDLQITVIILSEDQEIITLYICTLPI